MKIFSFLKNIFKTETDEDEYVYFDIEANYAKEWQLFELSKKALKKAIENEKYVPEYEKLNNEWLKEFNLAHARHTACLERRKQQQIKRGLQKP